MKAKALANADEWSGTETSILGHKISSPICIAPAGFAIMAHSDGEVALAWAGKDTCMCLSSYSNILLEDVA